MAFSFYQSLRTVPRDLDEVARGFRLTGWQKFWQLEAPFAMPGLIWNTMMSMSGGWFFVVASEAITVGNTTITLPGIGSFIAKANDAGDWSAIGAAVLTMGIVILLYDQLLFRPVVAWAAKFRVELSVGQDVEIVLGAAASSAHAAGPRRRRSGIRRRSERSPLAGAFPDHYAVAENPGEPSRLLDVIWILIIIAVAAWAAWVYRFLYRHRTELGRGRPRLRFDVLYPYSRRAADGSRDRRLGSDQRLDRLATSLGRGQSTDRPIPCRFPVNLLFGAAVSLVLAFHLNPNIWLSFLIVFGTQWYIVFNTIGGAAAFPNDLREAAANFRIRGWRWWREVMIPAIAPYYLTGAITASGGSWNASIVAEYVSGRTTRSSRRASAPTSPKPRTRATFRESCSASR